MGEPIKASIVGLSELRSDLREFNPRLTRALTLTHQTVSKMVASDARAASASRPGSGPKAGRSIVGGGTQTYAYVRGGKDAPFFFGAEFGSARFKQFPAWRGSGSDAGYFLWPTVRRDLPRVMADYMGALDAALAKFT